MKPRVLLLAAILGTCFLPSVADARYCNNPHCAMCNRLFGPMTRYSDTAFPVKGKGAAAARADNKPPPLIELRSIELRSIDSTPHEVVGRMLDQLHLGPEDTLYDLGCGDGRILIAAVKRFGCKAVGIEIDPSVAAIARRNVATSGVGRILVVTGDVRRYLLNEADAVTMYLFTPLMEELVPKIRPSVTIVSNSHQIPGRHNRRVELGGGQVIYVAEPAVLNARVL